MSAPPQARQGRGATSYDVARAAGVSQSAVSRAFRPGAPVAEATRQRVLAAARRLGYRPNAIAASLITRRSHMVALLISVPTLLNTPEVLSELTRCVSERDMRALLFALGSESEVDAVLDQVWRYRVDGVIAAARLSAAQLAMVRELGVPLVLFNRTAPEELRDSVSCAFAEAEGKLVDALVDAGHRRFALIAGPADSSVSEARIAGARHRLRERGLEPLGEARGDFGHASGHAAALALVRACQPDAIIAANDTMALGAMDALRTDLGLAVPEAVSVVGFDGIGAAAWPAYALTTMRQPIEAMAQAAVALLMARIEQPQRAPQQLGLSGQLVAGRSARLALRPQSGVLHSQS